MHPESKTTFFIDKFFRITLSFLMITVTVMIFIQVLLRYVFRAPLMGIEELLVFPAIWLYFLGGANASREGTQIVARVLEVFMKSKKKVFLVRTIGSSLGFIVSSWLGWWSYDYLRYCLRVSKESPTLYVPMIYVESAVFVGTILMAIYTLRQVTKDYLEYRNSSDDELFNPEPCGAELPSVEIEGVDNQ